MIEEIITFATDLFGGLAEFAAMSAFLTAFLFIAAIAAGLL